MGGEGVREEPGACGSLHPAHSCEGGEPSNIAPSSDCTVQGVGAGAGAQDQASRGLS